MNIFILSTNIKEAAQFHCDKHIIKMILESAQLLSTAHSILDDNQVGYKATHKNHPCTIWARTSKQNYLWLYELFKELSNEYTFRYGKEHLSWKKLKDVLSNAPKNIPDVGLTDFAQAMPERFKSNDAVQAYRDYYINEKASLLKYTKRENPYWI